MRRLCLPALAAVLVATPLLCAAQPDAGSDPNAAPASDQSAAPAKSKDRDSRLMTPEQQGRQGIVHGVAEQPFRDFNLVRSKIPPVLLAAIADPYERPPAGCPAIAERVHVLDEALGPDLDEPISTEHPGTLTRAEGASKTGALDAMRSGLQDEIPFDGFIRMLTGAERHDKLVLAAIQAGAIRRGYLKGLGEMRGCAPPGVPLHLAHPVEAAN